MLRLMMALALMLAGALATASPALAAPAAVEDYGKLPAMQLVILSPSGDRYAFVAEVAGVRNLYVATTDNQPLSVIPIGKVKIVDLAWAGDDYVIVTTSTTVDVGMDWTVPKQELEAAIVLNLKTGGGLGVFQNERNRVEQVVLGFYGAAQINDRWYGYFSTYSLEPTGDPTEFRHSNTQIDGDTEWVIPDLYRVDLQTGAIALAARGGLDGAGWLVGPGGDIVARALFHEKSGAWRIMTGGFGGRVITSGANKLGGGKLLGFGQTADTVLIAHDDGDGAVTEAWPLAGGAPTQVLDDKSDDTLIRDPRSNLWLGTTQEGDEPTSTLFSPTFNARVEGARKAFPGYRVRLISWSADFGRMIVFTDGGDDSGTYWFVDVAKKSAVPLGGAYPTVTPADVGPVRMVDWKAADGLALRGVLTLPPGREAKNLPLVVMPHGGPWARDYPGFDYWAQAFASRGYAVFQPNFRASTGYGDVLYKAGYGEWGRKMQTDISDGAAELAREGVVDPKRACIVGWSYGGYAALAGVTLQHGLYRCAVSMAGVADLDKFLGYLIVETGADSSAVRNWKLFLGASSGWDPWAAISPAKLADHADAPILLIHGKDDTVVPIDQSDAMERALTAAGKPVERLTLDGGDHWLLHEDTRVAMLKASVAFVEKYNPPDPAPPETASAK
jgi:dipeptidyl aminopeptidase/acylaminoacyl peptidase